MKNEKMIDSLNTLFGLRPIKQMTTFCVTNLINILKKMIETENWHTFIYIMGKKKDRRDMFKGSALRSFFLFYRFLPFICSLLSSVRIYIC